MKVFRFAGVAVLAATATLGLSQSWHQPWWATSTAGWGPSAIESRVFECYTPIKTPKMAVVDDFIATGRPVKRIVWWGTPSRGEQLKYPFQITFYRNDPTGNCKPDLMASTSQCVIARGGAIGADCFGRKIWKFTADLPFWFAGPPNTKYWLQISEVDEKSLRPGYVDFRWAFHQRTPNFPHSWASCEALGFDPALTLFGVVDPCTKEAKDMAFQLYP